MAVKCADSTHLREVFLTFLKLGFTAFGGPIAHLGYFQAVFVEQKHWLTPAAYAELVALCQFIPGPASSQVGFAIGFQRAGINGAIAAWLAFTLPSALIMLSIGISLISIDLTAYQGLLKGLKITAVAVVAWALWTMARQLTPDNPRRLIAVIAALVALLFPGVFGQLGGIFLGVLLSTWLVKTVSTDRSDKGLEIHVPKRIAKLSTLLFCTGLIILPWVAMTSHSHSMALVDAMYRAGALVFGGGHVVLPLLHAETVNTGLINADDFLAGYGVAQAMPGPLFSFSAFIGAQSGGILMALIALISIFLPGCFLLLAVLPLWQGVKHQVRLRQALMGINAAVVGLLAAALYNPVMTTGIHHWQDALLALILLGLLATARISVLIVVMLGAIAGYAFL